MSSHSQHIFITAIRQAYLGDTSVLPQASPRVQAGPGLTHPALLRLENCFLSIPVLPMPMSELVVQGRRSFSTDDIGYSFSVPVLH